MTPLFIGKMREVAKDIINYDRKRKLPSFKEAKNKFYGIMRKHGIRQGVWRDNGRVVDNFEWTMCWTLFLHVRAQNEIVADLFEKVPNDLLAYGRKPKHIKKKKANNGD